MLLVHANEVVPSDALIEALWPAQPPETAANALQVYVSGLRRALGVDASGPLETRPLGYAVSIEPDALDSDRFGRLLARGRAELLEGRPADAGSTLRAALALWRGPPLADFRYEPFAQSEIGRLEELRLVALEHRVDADLALGRHAELVGELEGLIRTNPLRERLRAQLMLALYRAGRQAEALEIYQEARRALVDELGIDPSPPLRELEAAILRQDPSLLLPGADAVHAPSTAPRDRVEEPPDARKLVTVVACGLAADGEEEHDAEALRRLHARVEDAASNVVSHHGGQIVQRTGESLLAVFGVPRAHEDDALRALRAAVDLRDALASGDDEIPIAFGVVSGEVIAAGGEGGPTITGDVVGAAGRLWQAAAAGEILLGQSAYSLVRADVVADPAEVLPPGRRHPIPAYALTSVLTRVAGPRRPDTPMVGRVHEGGRLADAFARVVRERSCRLLVVAGDAGVGKSRLVAEFAGSRRAEATVLVGRCLPYGDGITFWPVRELVREATGLGYDEPSERAVAKVGGLLKGEPDADLVVERLAQIVGLSEASSTIEESFWAVRRLLEALARRWPLVVVFEDVHWAEPTFLDLVEYVREWSRNVPLLLVCLARPEFLERRPGFAGRPGDQVLTLDPLTNAESSELLDRLSGPSALAPAVRTQIAAAAEGNPLFLEQILALVTERGAAADGPLTMPPSIQALLAARLDGLAPGERAVVDRAAVMGRSFPWEAVRDLLPSEAREALAQHLMALVRKELLAPEPRAEREQPFRFRHILIRDVAYAGIPKATRAELHERFGEWLDRHDGEYDEIVGYHLEQAFRYREEIGPVRAPERALAAEAAHRLDVSGRRALARSDLGAAINLLERASALLTNHDPARAALLPRLGGALVEAGRLAEAERLLNDAVELAEDLGDERLQAHALLERLSLGIQVDTDRAAEEARSTGERIRAVLEGAGDDDGLCRLWRLRGVVHWLEGRCAAADDAWGTAAEHARRAGNERERADILCWIASSASAGPIPAPAATSRCEAIRGEVAADPRAAAVTAYPLAALYSMRGRFDEARDLVEQAHGELEELGFIVLSSSFSQYEAFVETQAGDLVRAEEHLRLGLSRLQEMGEKALLSTTAALLANVLCAQDRYDEAAPLAGLAEELAAPDDVGSHIAWRQAKARILCAQGSAEEAAAVAADAVSLAGRTDLTNDRGGALLTLGRVVGEAGRAGEAERYIRGALEAFEAKGNQVAARAAAEELSRVVPA